MPDHETPIRLFAGSASQEFVLRMCSFLGIEMGRSQAISFSEGNTYVKIHEKVRGQDVYIVQSVALNPNQEFMELLFWIDAFKRASARSVTAIIPYFSYAKADKKDEPRVSIRARVCADCLETVGVDRILTMDLHSPQIQGFFKKPVDHLSAIPVLAREVKSLGIEDLVVVSPDAGFTKNARLYAGLLGAPYAIGDKIRREVGEKAEVLEIIGSVEGKNALLVDDFSLTCNTLSSAASQLIAHGAKSVYACISHSLLDEKGLKTLEASPIEKLLITDTVENAHVRNHPRIDLVSVAHIFADAVSAIHHEESLGALLERYNALQA